MWRNCSRNGAESCIGRKAFAWRAYPSSVSANSRNAVSHRRSSEAATKRFSGSTVLYCRASSSPAKVHGIPLESFLMGEILLPGDVSGIHLLFDLDPFLSRASDLNGAMTDRTTSWITRSPPVDKGPCVGRILNHLINGG